MHGQKKKENCTEEHGVYTGVIFQHSSKKRRIRGESKPSVKEERGTRAR
jgi:hypothetical protein